MITVNGKPRPDAPPDLPALLTGEGLSLTTRGIAVAINDTVIPRRHWPETRLNPGDRVEIVKVLQGG
jgi:sulfur carrier protein